MLFWRIKSKTLRKGEMSDIPCEHCGSDDAYMEYTFSQKYFQLYFIPLFPLRKKTTVYCDDCCEEYYNDEIPKAAVKKLNHIKDRYPIRTPLWMFTGTFVLVAFFTLAFWQSNRTHTIEGDYIKNPIKGDVYYIESKPTPTTTQYTTLRIDKVDKDNVYVTFNDTSTTKYTKVFGILQERYYTTKKGVYSRKKIQELYQKDSIISITRK